MTVRFLPTRIHGALDYVSGLALILAPWIFGFSEVSGAAMTTPMLLGAVIIGYSLLTDYEWGLLKVIPMSYHVVADLLGGILLSLSPWLFSFADEKTSAWVPHATLGLALIAVYFISQTTPGAPTPENDPG